MSDAGPLPTARPSHVPAPAVFLGALASEVNEPDELDDTFSALADVTERVVAALRMGHLSEQQAAEHLSVLRLTGQDGTQWSVGATSLRWYRKAPERGWKLAVPPPAADPAHQESLAAAVAALPADLIAQLGDVSGVQDVATYGVDPFAQAQSRPTAPWEYEPGDDRRMTYGDGSSGL